MVNVDLLEFIQSVWMGYKGELGELLVSVWIFPNLPTVRKYSLLQPFGWKCLTHLSGLSRKARLVPDDRKAFAATRSQSRRGPVGGGGTGESHYVQPTNLQQLQPPKSQRNVFSTLLPWKTNALRKAKWVPARCATSGGQEMNEERKTRQKNLSDI